MNKRNTIVIRINAGKSSPSISKDKWLEVRLFLRSKTKMTEIGSGSSIISKHTIFIDDLHIKQRFQRQNFGTMIVDIYKGLSRLLNVPICLYSTFDSVDFYFKNGFVKVKDCKNVVTKSGDEPEERDLIWIPEKLINRKQIIVDQ